MRMKMRDTEKSLSLILKKGVWKKESGKKMM